MEASTALMEISQAEQALQRADDIGEILILRDKSAAIQLFANAQGFKEAAQKAKIFQLKAERKAGSWLDENVSREGGDFTSLYHDGRGLPEGITWHESSRWQQEAVLPEEKFNDWIDESLANGWEISAAGLRHEAKHYEHEQKRGEMAESGMGLSIPETIDFRLGDFRETCKSIDDNSISMIFTDPPYDDKTVPLFQDMAVLARRVLKPGGSLITYVGHHAIPMVLPLMTPHLRFWWILALNYAEGPYNRLIGKNIFVEWKPLLWFVKGGRANDVFIADKVDAPAPDKIAHEWQQGQVDYYINNLTEPGETILDPFAGSGTTLIVASKNGRNSIGCEISEQNFNIAKTYINEQLR